VGFCLCTASLYAHAQQESIATEAKSIAQRLYASTPEDLPGIKESMENLSVAAFPRILVELYQSEYWTDEGSSVLVGLVWPTYAERVDGRKMQEQVLELVANPHSPMPLRRDLLHDVLAWIHGDDVEAIVNQIASIGEPGNEVWLYAQYGASKLLRAAHSQAQRKPESKTAIAKLMALSVARSKSVMHDLVANWSDDTNLERWTAKIIANYRGITPQEVDAALEHELSHGGMGVSKQLAILDVSCGGIHQSEELAGYVKRVMDEAVQQGTPLTASDSKIAERLLQLHGQR
jgi:hypothetical protein